MNEFLFKDIHRLAKQVKKGEISPVQIVKSALERIKKIDSKLNTFITINGKQAIADAKEMEKDIKKGNYKGPLHGIPLGIKDNIFTKNIKTTMGSEIYRDFTPAKNAFVIDRLIHAGAIIIGKNNTHQFAYGPTGDRSHVGPVHNPFNTMKMSGGSSGGSAAAVSAYLCYGSLGTDTGGSVRVPASFCGVVGMKPTFGSISNRGVYPLSWSLDHVGPLTRSITDNALLLNAMVAFDREDPKSIQRKKEDFTRLLGINVRGKKIGIPATYYSEAIDEEIQLAATKAITIFEKLGAEVKRINLSISEKSLEAQSIILKTEAYAVHENNLKRYPDPWDVEVKERLLTGVLAKGFEFAQALRQRENAKQEFNEALSDCDILLTPTMSILPPEIGSRDTTSSNGDKSHIRSTITRLTSPTNLTGLPSLSIPCGFSKDGLPIGVQLIGKELDEATLYQFGYALEQELDHEINKKRNAVMLSL
ncbi:amidase [Oceanobacillus alkalisoli]|uniref:amidase n=1 Tax=Oceanobacillus alkalisoli TaxID=2925113 RepID=UPI001EE4641E|nr:amidase [Oceanobacillus alkalisoli]MCG5105023.1 amidase [Oceanobacillus alkalisoli]